MCCPICKGLSHTRKYLSKDPLWILSGMIHLGRVNRNFGTEVEFVTYRRKKE